MRITTHNKSPNFFAPPHNREIKFIILHYTEMEFADALSKLCDENASVSSHYIIHKDGEIHQLVDDDNIAWHAGKSYWAGIEKLNECSIGIEIDNLGNEPFTDKQMDSCIKLCKKLQAKYSIESHNIIGHSDIAPDRKWDPGIFFDWDLLQKNNIGVKFQPAPAELKNNIIFSKGDERPEITNLQQKLQNIGYKIAITRIFDDQTNFVIRAFQAHFCQKSILEKGGIEYFQNTGSNFVWDEWSDFALDQINLYKAPE